MMGQVITLTCCDSYGNAVGDWYDTCISSQYPGSGNLHLHPQFKDRYAGNLRLHENSPCAPFTAPNPECDLIGAWPAVPGISDDDGVFENAVEFVDDYPGTQYDRKGMGQTEVDSMVSRLGAAGWVNRFVNGDEAAHRNHWSNSDESEYVGDVDITYFSGHGSEDYDWDQLRFAVGPDFGNDRLLPGRCVDQWGGRDLEWLGFSCCQMFRDADRGYWANALDGAHLLLGWKTLSKRRNRADTWLSHMLSFSGKDPAKRVAWSWFKMCDERQVEGRVARVIGESVAMKHDYLWGQGAGPQPDPATDDTYYWWDHSHGDTTYAVPSLAMNARTNLLPIYSVTPPSWDSLGVAQLGAALGVYGEVVLEEGEWRMASGDRYLRVSTAAGVDYGDLSLLWKAHEQQPVIPDPGMAIGLADAILIQAGLMPPDVDGAPWAGYSDTQGLASRSLGEVLASWPVQTQVLYRRSLGGYPVVGPGSHVLVYAGESGDVEGVTHIWRNLAAGPAEELIDSASVVELLERHGDRVTIGGMPRAEAGTLLQMGLGYWEEGFGETQDVVYPVWELLMAYPRQNPESVLREPVHIPAVASAMPLLGWIDSPPPDTVLVPGERIELRGSAEFGSLPYEFSWSSSLDGLLGFGPALLDSSLTTGAHVIQLGVSDQVGAQDSLARNLLVTENVDFGDAPAPYPVLVTDNGARHLGGGALWLGNAVDSEAQGQPAAGALGDDGNGTDDEDGLEVLEELVPGESSRLVITSSEAGVLDAWLDLDQDGMWAHPAEQILANQALTGGRDTLNVTIPEDCLQDSTYLRMRVSGGGGLAPTGLAMNGEVEDHLVLVACGVPCPAGAESEGEDCGLRLNNGCNLDSPQFTAVDFGETLCGISWADTNWRDTDWLQLDIDRPMRLCADFESDIQLALGLIEQTMPGSDDCADITGEVNEYVIADPCHPVRFEAVLPNAGTYWLIVLPLVHEGYPCDTGPHRWSLVLEGIGLEPDLGISVVADQVELTWDAVPGADTYHVERSVEPWPGSPGGWVRFTGSEGIADTSWSETQAANLACYRVVAETNPSGMLVNGRAELYVNDQGSEMRTSRPDSGKQGSSR